MLRIHLPQTIRYLITFCLILGFGQLASAQTEDVIRWIRETIVPFETAAVVDDLSDLEPLRELVGSARVVGLGEQTHGTSEFVTMKHRMIQFLVQEMGFDAVICEATWGGGLIADRFVSESKGTLDEALSSLEFFMYRNQEFVDLMTWLRQYNRSAETPVRLLGMDCTSPHLAFEWIYQATAFASSTMNSGLLRDIKYRLPAKAGLRMSQDPADWDLYFGFLDGLAERLSTSRPDLDPLLAPLQVEILDRIPYAIAQTEGHYGFDDSYRNAVGWVPASFNYRDHSMAENVLWWLNLLGPESKVIVYAHNGHIAKSWTESECETLGQNLHQSLGEDYVAFGFSTCEGTFVTNTMDSLGELKPYPIPELAPGSYDELLCQIDIPLCFLPLGTLEPETDAFDWMNTSRGFMLLGAGHTAENGKIVDVYDLDCTLPEMFDVLIHIRETQGFDLDW